MRKWRPVRCDLVAHLNSCQMLRTLAGVVLSSFMRKTSLTACVWPARAPCLVWTFHTEPWGERVT